MDRDELSEADRLLREDIAVAVGTRDVVRVAGPEAAVYLQGQLSQDVDALAPGDDAWSLLLQPQGKLVAHLRVSRAAADELLLDVADGWGEAVVERLERFKLNTDADIELLSWDWLAYRGPASSELEGAAPIVASGQWGPVPGVDAIGPGIAADPAIACVDLVAMEALRIEAGIAAMGAELDDRTIPAAAGIVDDAVSFTKGCYTGQELVARIDSRGSNTPTRLRGVVVDTDAVPELSAVLTVAATEGDGDGEVGGLTSVAWSPRLGAAVALAYVARGVDVPTAAVLQPSGDPCRIVELPITGD